MPSQRTGGGYCKWAVIDMDGTSVNGYATAGGELTMRDAVAAADRMNDANKTNRYVPGKHIGFGRYEPLKYLQAERTRREGQ